MFVRADFHSLGECIVIILLVDGIGLEEAGIDEFFGVSELIDVLEEIQLRYTKLQPSQLGVLLRSAVAVVKIVDYRLIADRDLQ